MHGIARIFSGVCARACRLGGFCSRCGRAAACGERPLGTVSTATRARSVLATDESVTLLRRPQAELVSSAEADVVNEAW
jgi:hypothetical protein